MRAVPALLKDAERRTSDTQTRSDCGGAFASDCTTKSWVYFKRLAAIAAIALAHAHLDCHNVDYNFATRGQNAFNLALHLGAVFNSRNTVGGVSWLGAQLFDLTEEGWRGLPFSPRPTVMYDGTKDILLTKDEVARHALARNLQCALTAEEQVAEGLHILRAELNPSATLQAQRPGSS